MPYKRKNPGSSVAKDVDCTSSDVTLKAETLLETIDCPI